MKFEQRILQELESYFQAEEIETMIRRDDQGKALPDVMILHKPSGIEVVADRHNTQLQNKVSALAELLSLLKR